MMDWAPTVNGIQLEHMSVRIDFERILTTTFDGDAETLALAMVQAFYNHHPIHNDPGVKNGYLQRALDQAKWFALNRLMNDWESLGERTTGVLLIDAEKLQWYQQDYFTYQSLEDLLSSLMEKEEEGSSAWYNWRDYIKTILPTAQLAGIPPDELYRATAQHRKARDATAVLKIIIEGDMPLEKKYEDLKMFIGQVADSSISSTQLRGNINEYRGKNKPKYEPLVGHSIFLPGGRNWIIVECNTPGEIRSVEMALGNLVDVHVTDWKRFTVQLMQIINTNGDSLTPEDKERVIEALGGKYEYKETTS